MSACERSPRAQQRRRPRARERQHKQAIEDYTVWAGNANGPYMHTLDAVCFIYVCWGLWSSTLQSVHAHVESRVEVRVLGRGVLVSGCCWLYCVQLYTMVVACTLIFD